MSSVLISNPPYNLKWTPEPFMQMQHRFDIVDCEIPPANNANYLFILDALEKADRCALILPNGVLTTENKQEAFIRKQLVEKNLIDAVIMNPGGMFESTSIPTCIIVLDKTKSSATVEMIDCRNFHEEEQREQNGQFGGNSHTNRTYVKKVNVYTPEQIDFIVSCVKERSSKAGLCKAVSVEEIRKGEYLLSPSRYIESESSGFQHRPYEDIVNELNRIIANKNMIKITMNETLIKNLGLSEFYGAYKSGLETDEAVRENIKKVLGLEVKKDSYFSSSKNKNEIKIENKMDGRVPYIMLDFLKSYKNWIQECNVLENAVLAELRDAMINDLMSGKIDVSNLP